MENNINKNYDFNINIYTFHKLALNILKQNNHNFQIAPDNFLDTIIDNFFQTIKNNKKFQKALKKLAKNDKEMINLKKLIKTFINLFKSKNYDITHFKLILKKIKFTINIKEYINNKLLLLFIINIYINYEYELTNEKSLDFNDMINKATMSIKKDGLKENWKYIIIDEYQDTSFTKFNMINEIIKKTKAKLLVVGDDYQSIYRFTGCDLSMFLNFTKYYPEAKIMPIINTYRNPQELIDIAGNFIMKNKKQLKKKLYSNKSISNPINILLTNNERQTFKDILNKLQSNDIMVLGRNNNDINMYIDNEFTPKNEYYTYHNTTFRYLTIHKSKGLESKVVIIINVNDDAIPSKIKNEKILKYVNDSKDYYPYEEERRLFYVALTRTKTKVFIISSRKTPSIFVKELLKSNKNIRVLER